MTKIVLVRDLELGIGIVVPQKTMVWHEHYVTDRKVESNLYTQTKTENENVINYAGFGCKKSSRFNNNKKWDFYLTTFSDCLRNSFQVTVKLFMI
ncbi:MAG: DUF4861 family protein [Maribacter sp.]|nr:DUF4861 family protein [Maribacter sp.]